ncbi:MAG: acyltransferase family protein [Bacteroidales bacterium]|nr:acyltransferase family protein [Bacteroidales bacterium]
MERRRFSQLDLIRLVAMSMMFMCHATDPYMANLTYGNAGVSVPADLAEWAARLGAFVRPCIPLFVMLTGALLLPVRTGAGVFYRKRIPRVLFPFLIWSALYYLMPWLTGLAGMDKSVVYRLFAWAETDDQTLGRALSLIVRIPYHFSFLACHVWYIYVLIGLYLYLPVFSAWVEKATRRQKEWFLGIWGVSLLLPYVTEFVERYAFGTCEWNSFGLFYYFAGFNGYLLLGHYLHTYVRWSVTRRVAVSLPLWAVGYIVSLSGYQYIMSLETQTPEQVELFWTYCTPNVAMMAVAWFVTLYAVVPKAEGWVARWLSNLTRCGFGMYMIHYFFIYLGFCVSNALELPSCLRIPCSALVILACAWSLTALAKRLTGDKSVWLLG